MSAPAKKLPQPMLPRGMVGRFVGWIMPLGHSSIYKRVAPLLNLQPEDDVLDVGCGAGYFLKRYAAHTNSIAGLDYSETMVGMATGKHKDRIAAGTAEIVHGEASSLPWEDNKFSAVTSMGSFIGFPKPLESIKEMYRVLRPGGRAVISIEYNAEDGKDHSKEVESYGMQVLSESEVRGMMHDAGFSEINFTYDKSMGMPKMMMACGVKQ